MEYDDERAASAATLRESPEDAALAIASALEFLRAEAAAIGLHEVGLLIGLARNRTCDYCSPVARPREPH